MVKRQLLCFFLDIVRVKTSEHTQAAEEQILQVDTSAGAIYHIYQNNSQFKHLLSDRPTQFKLFLLCQIWLCGRGCRVGVWWCSKNQYWIPDSFQSDKLWWENEEIATNLLIKHQKNRSQQRKYLSIVSIKYCKKNIMHLTCFCSLYNPSRHAYRE